MKPTTKSFSSRSFLFLSLILIAISASLAGCISMNVGGKPAEKAQELSYTDPAKPFSKIQKEGFDRVWQSKSTGNSIAYLSECKTATEPSLTAMEAETLNVNQDTKLISSKESTFNQRGSLETLAEAKLDGVEIKMAFLFFKKNGCQFTLSYVGRSKNFESEFEHFEKFKRNFRAP